MAAGTGYLGQLEPILTFLLLLHIQITDTPWYRVRSWFPPLLSQKQGSSEQFGGMQSSVPWPKRGSF